MSNTVVISVGETAWCHNLSANEVGKRDYYTRFAILSGPSGAGKTTVSQELSLDRERYYVLPNTTTRERRQTDLLGHFRYVTDAQYQDLMADDRFLFGRIKPDPKYGYDRRDVTESLQDHERLILMFRISGVQFFVERMPATPIIFLRPNSAKLARYQNVSAPSERDFSHFIDGIVGRLRERAFPFIILDNNYAGPAEVQNLAMGCREFLASVSQS